MTFERRVPRDVSWSEDGFSIELGQLRRCPATARRARQMLVAVVPLYLLVLAIEYRTMGSAFVLGTALVLFARQAIWLEERTLQVGPWGLRIGRRRVGADQLVGCAIRGRSLVVTTRQTTFPLPVGGLDEAERNWVCDQIRAMADRWRSREGEVPEALEALQRPRARADRAAN